MAQINLVPQRSQKDDRFGHRVKFIWKIECLLELMDSETVGSRWPQTSAPLPCCHLLGTMMSAASLTDCWDPADIYTHRITHLTSFCPNFFFLSHTNAIYSYDSKGFLVILCRMKRARNVPGITHTNTEKKVCSLWHWLGHLLADPQRKRKPPTYWQSKNEKQKWKGSSHINSPTSVQCLLSLLLFLQWLIIFFHVSVKCAGDRVRPQENTDAVLVMSPLGLR